MGRVGIEGEGGGWLNYQNNVFHISISTGSGVLTIFFYKGLARNPEIRNTPMSRVSFPQYLETGATGDTKFEMNVTEC